MIVSRSSSLLNIVRKGTKKIVAGQTLQVRNGHGPTTYRKGVTSYITPGMQTHATIIAAATWWWIIWHFWHEPGHVFGEFDYPDPSKWTNEELGIPPDNED
uniref:NADH dehydrogenase [ubiquinone] 1 beta subcomplex subunit 2, mitochondrial n=1 Tax=Clastoptera arizonana TaxID=38151 RepID=A0A1B6DAI7_9HEMI